MGWGSFVLSHVWTFPLFITWVFLGAGEKGGTAGSLSPSSSSHLSQKVCRQGRTLGHRYRSRQILHTRNCLSIGCTSGPGLSSLFAMVTTDGSCHSHQPVYRETVSSREASSPSPPLPTRFLQRNVPLSSLQGQDKVVAEVRGLSDS